MLISKQRKFIFIHIYKTAGLSMTNALKPFAVDTVPKKKWQRLAYRINKKIDRIISFDADSFLTHTKAPELINAIGRKTFDSYYSFAIVRNPWDWQVSLYHYMRTSEDHHQHEFAKSFANFDEYIRWRCAEEVRFQKDFIYSAEGELLVDFVGKFENIEDDFKTICSRIGVQALLPKLNVSNTKPYQEFYSEETRELVRSTFDADIKLFGYDFEPSSFMQHSLTSAE
jgi:hypothetical protein